MPAGQDRQLRPDHAGHPDRHLRQRHPADATPGPNSSEADPWANTAAGQRAADRLRRRRRPDRHPARHPDPGQHQHPERQHRALLACRATWRRCRSRPAPGRPPSTPTASTASTRTAYRSACSTRSGPSARSTGSTTTPTSRSLPRRPARDVRGGRAGHRAARRPLRDAQPARLHALRRRHRRDHRERAGAAADRRQLGEPGGQRLDPAGPNQHLDGYKALWYARSRWSTDDYDRMRRQRCVIGAVVQQADPAQVALAFPQIAAAAKNNITTGIPLSDLAAWVDLAQKVKKAGMRSLPFTTNVIDPADPDIAAMRGMVAEAINPPPQPSSAPSAAPSPRRPRRARRPPRTRSRPPRPRTSTRSADLAARRATGRRARRDRSSGPPSCQPRPPRPVTPSRR